MFLLVDIHSAVIGLHWQQHAHSTQALWKPPQPWTETLPPQLGAELHDTDPSQSKLQTGHQASVVSAQRHPRVVCPFTYACVASEDNTSIIKFAAYTTVTGLITNGKETTYRKPATELVSCCLENHLSWHLYNFKNRKYASNIPIYLQINFICINSPVGSLHFGFPLHNAHLLGSTLKNQQLLYDNWLVNFFKDALKCLLTCLAFICTELLHLKWNRSME